MVQVTVVWATGRDMLASVGDEAAASMDITHRPPALAGDPFTLGVASGDPRPDAVVLSTRLADPVSAISTQLACTIQAGSPEAIVDEG